METEWNLAAIGQERSLKKFPNPYVAIGIGRIDPETQQSQGRV